MRLHGAAWLPATMMVASALLGTLEAVFLREIGTRASQAQILLFRSGAQLLLVAASAAFLLRSTALVLRTTRLGTHLWRGGLAYYGGLLLDVRLLRKGRLDLSLAGLLAYTLWYAVHALGVAP